MKNLAILILLAGLVSPPAQASLDDRIRSYLRVENSAVPDTLSDIGVGILLVAPLVSSVIAKNGERRFLTSSGVFIANYGLTQAVKELTKRKRPNGENDKSFFSGHTSTAFAGAGLLCAYEKPWMCASSLALATSTGLFRIMADKHWFSDVLVGATVGFAFGRLVPMVVVHF